MTLYALIDTKNQKLMLISDSKKEVQFWTKGNDGYIVLSTDSAYHRPINSKRFKKKDFMKEV